ncbi:MAG TPA: NFACT RNA binding domain-containing protein [Chlorobaculum sp.]|nr:NFACT RNA binding domain-containing protein [Chlorobaculum sp.]
MLRNYFTLYHVARELHEQLAGGYLFEIHSQEKNEITLGFVTVDGRHLQLIVTVRSQDFSLSTREGLNRKRRNSAGIMSCVFEQQVTGVAMAPRDREIRFTLEDGHTIVLRLFSADTNVLLVRDRKIVEAFKEGKDLEGCSFDEDAECVPVFRTLESLTGSESLFRQKLEAAVSEESLEKRLSSILPGFDRRLARQLIARAGSEDPERLFLAFTSIFYELASPSPCVIEKPDHPPSFSILESVGGKTVTSFDTVLDAMSHYSRKMHRYVHLHDRAGDMRRGLIKMIGKAEKELASRDASEMEASAKGYETFGHLLTGAIGKVRPGSEQVTVPNIFDPAFQQKTIAVKPELNIQENAAWYFAQASKSRKKLIGLQTRHAKLRRELEALRRKLDEIDAAETPDEIQQLLDARSPANVRSSSAGLRNEEKKSPFRTIPLTRTITLYVGRNAENNELLTFEHARPDDVWLHARGASGSHCVLKGAGMHNMSEIRRAAEIAAWYSSARTSGLVPVIYTQKKYVRKAKGAAGSVIVEREKVVMVRPLKD